MQRFGVGLGAVGVVRFWLLSLSLILLYSTTGSATAARGNSAEAGFVETFDDVPGLPSDSFSRSLAGVQFDFTFTADGDGGNGQGFAHEDNYGEGDSDSINLQSGDFDASKIERVTITRNDGQPFLFNSIFIRNTAGDTISVAGYLSGTIVDTAKTMPNGDSGTLNFNSIVVDEVRLTSPDFFNTNIDSFAGDTSAPTTVAVSSFQAVDLQEDIALWLVILGLLASITVRSLRRFAYRTIQ